LRLLDNNTTNLTAGSRLFPGIRKGTIKFSLYASNLSDLFSFSLREPYSYVHNAPGTVFQFMLEGDGSLRVYNREGNRVELPVQTDITTGTWHDIELHFDVAAKQIGVWVDGSFKGTVENYLDGNLITHFNIASGSTVSTGTDVYIDNLIIQDTEAGLPIAGAIGSEQWADFMAPSTIASLSPAGPNGSGGWYSRDVTVTLATYDNVPGVTRTEYRINGGEWSAYDREFILTADGMNKVEYRSIDSAGNVEDVNETTIRIDKTAPLLSLTLDITSIDVPNHNLVPIHATLNYSDGLSGIHSVILRSITSNEADNGLGDGNQSNDIQDALLGTEDVSFSVRAERSGNGEGRVYTVTYAAIDQAGNETTAVATVTIPHDSSGKL
jgi:hypothetical protein